MSQKIRLIKLVVENENGEDQEMYAMGNPIKVKKNEELTLKSLDITDVLDLQFITLPFDKIKEYMDNNI